MTDPFLAEVRLMAFNFAPKGWTFCNGQLLPINQNQALFSLLGTTYGGDGIRTFALPDLQGRVPVHMGNNFTLGQKSGEEFHTLLVAELPAHLHALNADAATPPTSNTNTPTSATVLGQAGGFTNPGNQPFQAQIYNTSTQSGSTLASQSIANAGGSQPHENRQPYLVVSYCIAVQGIFPSRP